MPSVLFVRRSIQRGAHVVGVHIAHNSIFQGTTWQRQMRGPLRALRSRQKEQWTNSMAFSVSTVSTWSVSDLMTCQQRSPVVLTLRRLKSQKHFPGSCVNVANVQ